MEFTPGNRRVYDTDSPVSLDLFSKNNSVIQVNVYRIASKVNIPFRVKYCHFTSQIENVQGAFL